MTFKQKWNDAWDGFQAGKWNKEVNLRDFIQLNYTPYDGDDSFLAGPTQNTKDLWAQVMELTKQERAAGGVLDMDTKIVSTLTSHDAGYLDRAKETIVGVQTDKPFKRSLQPFGGIRIAEQACETNGYKVDPEISYILENIEKLITKGYLMFILQKLELVVQLILLLVYQMVMDVDVLLGTIVELHFMV